jgi:electron transfer flavoprotein alpha subunit
VAARLGLGLTSDCIDLEVDAQGNLVQHKPAFGGNIVAPILSRTWPQMATVRPGMFAARPLSRTEIVPIPADAAPPRARVVSTRTVEVPSDLESADVVVGFGMGIGGPENLPMIRELAGLLGAPLATTRDVCDRGWIWRHHQVGLTGRAIAPRVYVAIGIRGAFEHTVGIRKAGTVVAINHDPEAWIWDSADYGVKADWKTFVPELIRALRRSRD